jgi:pyrimidine operon attenuation protein/uracil phosphoribosyltransferase
MSQILVMSPERVERAVSRLAHQVIERNQGADRLEVIGIRRRGVAVARALAGQIEDVAGRAFDVHELDITPYRDDRERVPAEDASVIHDDLTDRDVILVDDVLFTGRTARAALDAIVHYGRPRSIQLVILVDRGHREYPIQPDCVGRTINTKHDERVEVAREEGGFGVYVEE